MICELNFYQWEISVWLINSQFGTPYTEYNFSHGQVLINCLFFCINSFIMIVGVKFLEQCYQIKKTMYDQKLTSRIYPLYWQMLLQKSLCHCWNFSTQIHALWITEMWVEISCYTCYWHISIEIEASGWWIQQMCLTDQLTDKFTYWSNTLHDIDLLKDCCLLVSLFFACLIYQLVNGT